MKPTEMSFEEAAALPQAGVLAYQGLFDLKPIQPGDKVLFNGAGGGVGTLGIQMAKELGAEVTAVDRGDKLDMLKSLGADHVFPELLESSMLITRQVLGLLEIDEELIEMQLKDYLERLPFTRT